MASIIPPRSSQELGEKRWLEGAVGYEVYIRSFADGNGDGVGDLAGLLEHLDHLSWLGIDIVWITPFYPSPLKDWGYAVADYTAIDPMYGTLTEFDAVVEGAHALGLRVIIDIVPNHSSDQHRWFRSSTSGRHNPYRDYYIWADPGADGGPPNNWVGYFGGEAWSFDDSSGQYYCHLFLPEQPDLNWRNPAVLDEFDAILRFWLDRGIDGFRIDVAQALVKDAKLRSNPQIGPWDDSMDRWDQWKAFAHHHDVLQPESVDVFRRWKAIALEYDALLLGETYDLDELERIDRLLGGDALDVGFRFGAMHMKWNAADIRSTLELPLGSISAGLGWAQDSHDEHRSVTRFGGGDVGRRRALSFSVLLLGLPGVPFLYQGQELGLESGVIGADARLDPVGDGSSSGRDGARTPFPWDSTPGFGFTSSDQPWLPFGGRTDSDTVEYQRDRPESWLHLHRRLLDVRRSLTAMAQRPLEWVEASDAVVAFRRGDVLFAANTSEHRRPLPLAGEVLYRTSATGGSSESLGADEAMIASVG